MIMTDSNGCKTSIGWLLQIKDQHVRKESIFLIIRLTMSPIITMRETVTIKNTGENFSSSDHSDSFILLKLKKISETC